MADPRRSSTRRAVLSYDQLKQLTDNRWPDLLVKDYQGILQDFVLLADDADNFDQRIADNTIAIEGLDVRVTQNEADIQENSDNILNLEHRAFGEDRPQPYDESATYIFGDLVVYPTDDPQNYYQCTEDTPSPAGEFDSSYWVEKSIRNTTPAEQTVVAGYGGIIQAANSAFPNITAAYQTFSVFDSASTGSPVDVVEDFANNGIVLNTRGEWSYDIKITLTFDPDITGRTIKVRLLNEATATPSSDEIEFYIPANNDGVNLSIPKQFLLVTSAEVSNRYVIEIGGGSNFSNVNSLWSSFNASRVSAINTIV